MLYSGNADEEQALVKLGISGALPPVTDDFLAVVGQNASQSKIDWYLRRSITYDARWDPATGVVSSTIDVDLRNAGPAAGQPADVLGGDVVPSGRNLMYLEVYSPLTLVGATVDGQQTLVGNQTELGRYVYTVPIAVAPGGERHLHMVLTGRLAPRTYRLDVSGQPAPVADQLTTSLTVPDGWVLAAGASGAQFAPLEGDHTLTGTYRRNR
jgi:hypothetical protein